MTDARAHGTDKAGFALLAVLVTGAFIAVLAATMSRAAQTEGAVSHSAHLAATARAAADGAVREAIFDLLSESDNGLARDGTLLRRDRDGVEVTLALQDVAGLVDLNSAPPELLFALVMRAGGSSQTAAALVEGMLQRRGQPGSPARGGAGAQPQPLRSIAELASLAGMTPELYRRLAPLVTVASRQPGIDPLTVPAEVIAALPGIDPAVVPALLTQRMLDPSALRRLLPGLAKYFTDSPRTGVRLVAIATASGMVAERWAVVRLARGANSPYRIIDWQAGIAS